MHLDEEQIQRLLHGELAPEVAPAVREHVAKCAECRARADESHREEEEIHALLGRLDVAPPGLDARTVVRQARARPQQHERHVERWVAGILVALGVSGVAYAIPGSPFRAWVKTAVSWVEGWSGLSPSGDGRSPHPEPEPPQPPPAPAPPAAGIAVAPGRELVVTFTSARGQARVSLIDGAQVVVRAPAGAAGFTSHVDRLIIDNVGSAIYDIEIPRTAPRVEVRVGDRRLFLVESGRIQGLEPAESSGSRLVPLAPSGR
jgi:hypothetical protein